MGRKRIENKKVPRSGRFQPEFAERIDEIGKELNLNTSQAMEYLINLGFKNHEILQKEVQRKREESERV